MRKIWDRLTESKVAEVTKRIDEVDARNVIEEEKRTETSLT